MSDLVERVARAACTSVNGNEAWEETGTDVHEMVWFPIARAAIAMALEEAAKVADAKAITPDAACEIKARSIAAAIRAMIPKNLP